MTIIGLADIASYGKELRGSLVADLKASNALRSPALIAAFLKVPRHAFVPRFFIDRSNTGTYEVLDGAVEATRREWLERAYSDDSLPTQVEDSKWLSSSSQPALMALMLEALNLTDTETVLEAGLGTGYNGALLCEALGEDKVTSVDIDKGLVETAQERLHALGYHPTLATVDAGHGYPARAPYDRIIATCSLPHVPDEWIDQTTEGGLILVNLYRDLGGGALACLRVADGQASGHFADFYGGFMPTRTHDATSALERLQTDRSGPGGLKRTSELDSTALRDDAFEMLAALRISAQQITTIPQDEPERFWLLGPDGSYACQWKENGESVVEQGGPVDLWDALEGVHDDWTALGRPSREAFGLTVTPTGEHVIWHDSPNGLTWPLSGTADGG